jgi:hypothetical protein
MGSINIRISLAQVDLDALGTDEQIRAAAKWLVPNALREMGEASAEIVWKEMQKAFRGPGFKPNNSASDKRKFIDDAGREYARKASSKDKKELEDYIFAEIEAQKSKRP